MIGADYGNFFSLLTGQEFQLPIDAKIRPHCENTELLKRLRKLDEIRDETLKKLPDILQNQRDQSNKNRLEPPFGVGDLVLVYMPARTKELSEKLRIKYDGPYEVVEKISRSSYKLDTKKRGKNRYLVIQADRLKKFTPR